MKAESSYRHLPLRCRPQAQTSALPRALAPRVAQRLVVFGCEVGVRWAAEVSQLMRALFRFRCPGRRAGCGWLQRWWGIRSCAQQAALSSTLLGQPWRAFLPAALRAGGFLSEALGLVDRRASNRPMPCPLQIW